MYYTDTPRQEDVGILTVGHSVIEHMTVPPRVQNSVVNSFCFSDCTNSVSAIYKLILNCNIFLYCEDGITVFENGLHLHAVGKHMITPHTQC